MSLLAVSVLALVIGVLVAVLVIVLVGILIVVLGTVAVLVIHNLLPSSFIIAVFRYSSMPLWSGLILCFEYKTCQKSGENCDSDSARGCLQTTGKDA